mgnify:CR=1 FL=1
MWEIKETAEYRGNHRVLLSFREADSPDHNLGEEELYIDSNGQVIFRQILRWPSQTTRPRWLFWSIVSLVLLAILGSTAFAWFLWGPRIPLS